MSAVTGWGASATDVVVEIFRRNPDGHFRAIDLQMVRGENHGIKASIQSISNALRHAEGYSWVKRFPHKPGRGATWYLTMRGRCVAQLAERERTV